MSSTSPSAALRQSDEFMQAVRQTIDALSFAGTHEPDADFRAHSLGHLGRVRDGQAEQRRRIQHTYGARPPSPNLLGTQLLAEYRGEAASVQIAREAAAAAKTDESAVALPTAVTNFTESQCRMFKKEMKQRIHEWERAVREATGQEDVLPEQKASLRAVYELYKACKNKVMTPSSDGRAAPNASLAAAAGKGGSSSSVPRHSSSLDSPVANLTPLSSLNGSRASLPRLSASSASVSGATDVMSSPVMTTGKSLTTAPTATTTTTTRATTENRSTPTISSQMGSSSLNSNNNNAIHSSSSNSNNNNAVSSSGTGPSASVSEMERSIIRRLPKVQLGRTAAAAMTDAEIAEEKRRIKQVLHRFEVEFESVQGERPTPQHRAGLAREYHRYGELKSELTKRAGGGSSNHASASRQRST